MIRVSIGLAGHPPRLSVFQPSTGDGEKGKGGMPITAQQLALLHQMGFPKPKIM